MNPWEHRAEQWHRIKPPFRPSPADLDFVQGWIDRQAARNTAPLQVLILGSTLEYHGLRWPQQTRLLAVDYSQVILDTVWPGPPATKLCANWLSLTPAIGHFDLVLGDACLCQLNWPDQHVAVVQVLRTLLLPGALVLTRMFARDEQHESIEEVVKALKQDQQPDASAVKLRLWLADQRSTQTGVKPKLNCQHLQRLVPDEQQRADLLGLSLADARLLVERYQNDLRTFHYATRGMITDLFCREPGGFALEDVFTPAYPMGQHCPSLALRRIP